MHSSSWPPALYAACLLTFVALSIGITTWTPLPIVQSDEIAAGIEARSIDLWSPLSWLEPWNVASGYQHVAEVPLRAAQIVFGGVLDPLTAGRMAHVVCGAVMVTGLFGFGRHLVGSGAAAMAALLLMVNHVHVHLSRAFICTGVQSAAGLTIVLWLLLSLRPTMSWRQCIGRGLAAGFVLGWTTQTYALAFGFPPLVCASVWLWRERFPISWVWIVGAILLGCAPLLVPWLAGLASCPEPVAHAGYLAADSRQQLQHQTMRALTMWWIGPDEANNYGASMAVLDPVTGALFGVGLALGIRRWRLPSSQLMAIWFCALLAGAVIFVNNGAGYYRLSCSLLFASLIAGQALWAIASRWGPSGHAGAVAALAVAAWFNLHYTFVKYPTEVKGSPIPAAVNRVCAGTASPEDVLLVDTGYGPSLKQLQCPDQPGASQ